MMTLRKIGNTIAPKREVQRMKHVTFLQRSEFPLGDTSPFHRFCVPDMAVSLFLVTRSLCKK